MAYCLTVLVQYVSYTTDEEPASRTRCIFKKKTNASELRLNNVGLLVAVFRDVRGRRSSVGHTRRAARSEASVAARSLMHRAPASPTAALSGATRRHAFEVAGDR